ncbi:RNA polymerase II C-terminal domain kinase beta subunit [Coemansia sp. RSA 552]|nr:RNA polymerase II C-terminal domain kinase beta subunit [Coemansia sp. RSA 552]
MTSAAHLAPLDTSSASIGGNNNNQRLTFMTRKHIVSLLNSDYPGKGQEPQGHLTDPAERNELLDHPAMASATKSCVFIKEIARSLGFPARTISTAQLLVHRVYIFRPSPPIGSTEMAASCLLVAAKMEETIKRLRDILAHTYLLSTRPSTSPDFEPQSVPVATTDKMRPGVLAGEQLVLDAIGFDFRTSHPHLLFVKLAKMAGASRQTTAAAGWQIIADAFYTTLPIQYPSAVIATGSLCLAWNLDCQSPEDTTTFILESFGSLTLQSQQQTPEKTSRHRDAASGRRRRGSIGNSHDRSQRNGDRRQPPRPPRRPEGVDLASGGWWTAFGVETEDIQGFVRQIIDFYLLFFNSTVASTEYMERHSAGLPSREMAQRIGQWRMKLDSKS